MSGSSSAVSEVLVVWYEPDAYLDRLSQAFPGLRVRAASSWEAAPADIGGTEILVTHGHGLSADLLARMPKLAWIQCLFSGVDHLAAVRAARPDLLITSCSGIHGPQMAEAALLHMLALSRRLALGARDRAAHVWPQHASVTALERKTVVIVGTGASGTRLARLCAALDMTVYAVSRSARVIEGVTRVYPRERLVEAARRADYLVLVLPFEAETAGIVGRDVFAAMKPASFVVNLARGGVVDEDALIEALRSGQIAGAGLDVFGAEPLPPESPLWEMDNVFLTPHIAGRSDLYNEHALDVVVPNLRHYLDGELGQLTNVIGQPPASQR